MKLLNFSVIKLSICLIIGILIASFIDISLAFTIYITACCIALLILVYFISKQKERKTIWFGVVSFITMVCIGILTTNLHNEKQQKNHYTSINSKQKLITFRIRTTLKPGVYNKKYIVDILKIADVSVSGKALLSVSKDSLNTTLAIDDIYITSEGFKPIVSSLNPHQFNYKKYLERHYIYSQLYVKPKQLFSISKNKHTLFGYADLARVAINNKLKNHHFKPEVLAILNALILGQRQELSNAILNDYKDAGAIHILAISGLHVGILLLILKLILIPLKRIKYGKQTTIILLIICMWSFAIIAGLSASVTRAVTMFSIIAFGMHLKKPTNILNTLAISVFFLLLLKPMFLFNVGFQLSYLAVIGIVVIQPKLTSIWEPKNYIFKKTWSLFTLGVAAQFGVVPISLFYFHQFPALFFVANIVIIPFLGIILGLGILVIILALLNALPQFLVDVFSAIISNMNALMKWTALQERFLFKDIPFNGWQVVSAYLIIIAFVQLAIHKKYKSLKLALISLLIFQSIMVYTKYKNSTNNLTIFHKSRHTIIGQKTNNKLNLYSDLDSIAKINTIKNYTIGNRIADINENKIPSIIKTKSKTLLIVDSLGVYNVSLFKPEYIVLIQSPRINLNRLIDAIKPHKIIADGSNYKSYVSQWEKTCVKQKIPFHYTGKKGAFILD